MAAGSQSGHPHACSVTVPADLRRLPRSGPRSFRVWSVDDAPDPGAPFPRRELQARPPFCPSVCPQAWECASSAGTPPQPREVSPSGRTRPVPSGEPAPRRELRAPGSPQLSRVVLTPDRHRRYQCVSSCNYINHV